MLDEAINGPSSSRWRRRGDAAGDSLQRRGPTESSVSLHGSVRLPSEEEAAMLLPSVDDIRCRPICLLI
jgi:hypothetical protein